MRTTINLNDHILNLVRQFSEQRRISLGDAATFLLERGLTASAPQLEKNGFALFKVDSGTPTFGLADVEQAAGQEDEAPNRSFAAGR